MPQVFKRVSIRWLWWCSPPFDVVRFSNLHTCFGSLSCMKQCPSGNTACTNGNSVCCMISTYTGVSIIPSKTQIPVLPRILIPAHMWTLVGCIVKMMTSCTVLYIVCTWLNLGLLFGGCPSYWWNCKTMKYWHKCIKFCILKCEVMLSSISNSYMVRYHCCNIVV